MDISESHKQKFSGLLQLIDQHNQTGDGLDSITITSPEVLGDNYEEIILNLGLLAENRIPLNIAPPSFHKCPGC